jgi:hypothetical protein
MSVTVVGREGRGADEAAEMGSRTSNRPSPSSYKSGFFSGFGAIATVGVGTLNGDVDEQNGG